MATFIVQRIEEKRDNYTLKEAQNLYKAYFIDVNIYAKWKASVDSILTIDGYADCIVNELKEV
ncbi:hypothetical protein PMX22_09890 [Clostridium butyricum]|uniref:hypothetical protein n=1 Tax=Clostridium butyricum TaxID=1492 RepID=UPI00232B8BD4|nr:hypothetical protein [Clostridium butyricum]MDB2160111.1 hypothetical protein [Clostridium butyricum]